MDKPGKNGQHPVEDVFEVDLEELRQRAANLGIDVYDNQRQEKIRRVREIASRASQSNRAIQTAGDFLAFKQKMSARTGKIVLRLNLFTGYLLPPVGVVGLWIVEIQRVYSGVKNWDAPALFLLLMSAVIVSVYISLLTIRARMQQDDSDYQGSLGLVWRRIVYWMGIGKRWTPVAKTQMNKLDDAIRWQGRLIILLGTVGALRGELAIYDVWWAEAIRQIITESHLVPFFELAGGVITTWALLAALHFVIQLTYTQFEEILPEAERADFFGTSAAAYSAPEADLAEAMYWQRAIQQKERERQSPSNS
jgi:hypothetical protein